MANLFIQVHKKMPTLVLEGAKLFFAKGSSISWAAPFLVAEPQKSPAVAEAAERNKQELL